VLTDVRGRIDLFSVGTIAGGRLLRPVHLPSCEGLLASTVSIVPISRFSRGDHDDDWEVEFRLNGSQFPTSLWCGIFAFTYGVVAICLERGAVMWLGEEFPFEAPTARTVLDAFTPVERFQVALFSTMTTWRPSSSAD